MFISKSKTPQRGAGRVGGGGWGIRTMFAIGWVMSIGLLVLLVSLISPRMLESQEEAK